MLGSVLRRRPFNAALILHCVVLYSQHPSLSYKVNFLLAHFRPTALSIATPNDTTLASL